MAHAQIKSLLLGSGAAVLALNQIFPLIKVDTPMFINTSLVFGLTVLDVAAIITLIGLYWLLNREVA